MQPTRIAPALPVGAYTTYQVLAPLSTHFRPATCEEVDCEAYRNGWRVRIEGLAPAMLHAARTCGRRYRELQVAQGETWLVYEPGQPCLKATTHTTRLDRPEIYLRRPGDWRGLGEAYRHSRPEHWVDDFATHQQQLADRLERG